MTAELRLMLRMQLTASGRRNVRNYEQDGKKRKKASGEAFGQGVLLFFLALYFGAQSWGLYAFGLGSAVPLSCALAVSAAAFLFTFFKTNGTLFRFREYELLMSLPFPAGTVAASRFFLMALRSLPWVLAVSLPTLLCGVCMGEVGAGGALLWLLLSFVLPLIPMAAASALGALIAALGSRFRHKQLVQTVLTVAFVIAALSLRFILPEVFKNGETEALLAALSDAAEKLTWYLPAVWFARAAEGELLPALALLLCSLAVTALFLYLLGRSYRSVNSRLAQTPAKRKSSARALRCRGVTESVAYNELRRLLSSTTYLINAGMGQLLTAILCIALIFVDMDSVIAVITTGAPVTGEMILPAVPLMIHFLLGMVASTCCSPSLEGKQSWIAASLPIPKRVMYRGKMLMNLWITVPFALLGNLCCALSLHAKAGETLLMLLCGCALCFFSTEWGLWCGVKHIKLDWDNEIEVIKQGSAVAWYLFPNMLLTCALLVGAVIFGGRWGSVPVLSAVTAAALLCSLGLDRLLMKQAKE